MVQPTVAGEGAKGSKTGAGQAQARVDAPADADKEIRALAERRVKGEKRAADYLAAGRALEKEGRHDMAADCYDRAVNLAKGYETPKPRQALVRLFRDVAPPNPARIPDGMYQGTCRGFCMPLSVEVKVGNHRITAVRVTKHREDRPLDSLEVIPARIVQRQGLKGVDAVTGATYTSNTIMAAAGKALAKGVRKGRTK